MSRSKDIRARIDGTDKVGQVGTSTWVLADHAIRAGMTDAALALLSRARAEVVTMHDAAVQIVGALLDYVAESLGEEKLEEAWRFVLRRIPAVVAALEDQRGLEDLIRIHASFQRGHLCGEARCGSLEVRDEDDRYVMTLSPCGSGGVLRKSSEFGRTRKAYPWSWGRAGVPYYCTHCYVFWEAAASERHGTPLRVHENVDVPDAPCRAIYHKRSATGRAGASESSQ